MRKRDRIKSYIPIAIGGVNLWTINLVMVNLDIPAEGVALLIAVGLWAILTVVGVSRMDNIINQWDKDDREEDEV